MLRDFCKSNLLGNKKTTSKAYEITVQNNKKQSIELVIEDQIPVSQNGEITVAQEDISGATIDADSGKLTWKLILQHGETQKKQLRFTVTYPKKTAITGI